MDLGTLVKLQTAADQAPMQYMGELTNALSDTIRNRNSRSMEQDAMKFFGDGNVSMDKIQQFQQMYPGVPAVEVMKQAATIGTQVEAQAMKDMYNTVGSIIQENGGKLDPKAFSEAMLKFTPQQRQQFMKLTVANPNFLKQFSVTRSQEDETKRTVETDALGNVTKEIKGTPKETTESRDIEMTGPDGKTVGKFTKSESLIMENKGWKIGKAQFAPDKQETESGQHVTRSRINPKTKQKETSTGIFLPKTKTTQWNEDWTVTDEAKDDSPRWTMFREKGTNKIKTLNLKEKADRDFLEKNGDMYDQITESPIQSLIRDALSGQGTAVKEKDKFGFVVGEVKEKDGKKYKYIGADKWERF